MKKLIIILAALSGFFIAKNVQATCDITSSWTSGQTLTAASLNSFVTQAENCNNGILDGDTFTGNVNLHSAADLNVYSDTGTTLKASIDGATGKIIGAPQRVGVYNIELVRATTTNSGDSLKVQCGGAACSTTNPGFVVMNGTTAGVITTFIVTSDVTQLLTGATWGIGGTGDITGALIRAIFVNDNGTLRTCFAYLGGRNTVLTTDTNATQASVNLPEEILCNTAVASSTNTALDWGFARANFDDTGGTSEDLWAVQSGVNDVVTGVTADGFWQPWNPSATGFTSSPTPDIKKWTQNGANITFTVSWAASTSNSTSLGFTVPIKTRDTTNGISVQVVDNSGNLTSPGLIEIGGDTATATCYSTTSAAGTGWTAANNKRIIVPFFTYQAGPTASFIQ